MSQEFSLGHHGEERCHIGKIGIKKLLNLVLVDPNVSSFWRRYRLLIVG